MKQSITICALIFLFLTLIASSCKDNSNPVSSIDDIVFPTKNISYYRTIQPLFNLTCSVDGCHDFKTKASGLDLTSYGGLVSKIGIPKDTNSVLIWVIEGRSTTPMPPPPYRPLNVNQIKGFKQWISEGATDTIK